MLLYFLKKFVMDLGSVGLWILHRPLYPSNIHQNDNKLNFYKKIFESHVDPHIIDAMSCWEGKREWNYILYTDH